MRLAILARGSVSASANVATDETTTSLTYTDLATSGPAVTLSPGIATDQIILLRCVGGNNTASDTVKMSVAIAGASAVDADAATAALGNNAVGFGSHVRAAAVANASTHTAKYRAVTGGTANFFDRRLSAYTLT